MTKEYILNFLKINKQLLNEKYSVTQIGLFGSYATDMANENSDIDLAIVSTKKDFFLREDLREFLESNFHLKVDVGYLDNFREYYKEKIEKDLIYV